MKKLSDVTKFAGSYLTWHSRKRELEEKVLSIAKDMADKPHALQDAIDRLDEHELKNPTANTLFNLFANGG